MSVIKPLFTRANNGMQPTALRAAVDAALGGNLKLGANKRLEH